MAAELGEAWCRAEGAAPCPLLDTHTPECEHEKRSINDELAVKFWRTKSSRRLFSRVMLGLLLPGRCYFCTFTSSPQSPDIRRSYAALRMYLKRNRKGCSWIHVFTAEGHGVLHMVIRLRSRQRNLDIKEMKAYWKKLHKADQVTILRVRHANKLANYLSDQRKKRKLGSEMSWQDLITSWHWSKGWIPTGFTKKFGRYWYDMETAGVPSEIRDKEIRILIKEAHKNV